MLIASDLPLVVDSRTLANHLGVSLAGLWYTALNKHAHYRVCAIRSKSGKRRILHIPDDILKLLQRSVLNTFLHPIQHCLSCTNDSVIGAYVPGVSTRDVAHRHVRRKLIISTDLENFFPSVKRAMIRNFFTRQVALPEEPASLLAQILTYRNFVPQGAPTSGAIANIIAFWKFDRFLLRLCKKRKFTYTRYSDDMVFSTDEILTDEDVAAFLAEVESIVTPRGFKLNKLKTRHARNTELQVVLGLAVNDKVGILRSKYLHLRGLANNCVKHGLDTQAVRAGFESGERLGTYLNGMLSYLHSVDQERETKLRSILSKLNSTGATT